MSAIQDSIREDLREIMAGVRALSERRRKRPAPPRERVNTPPHGVPLSISDASVKVT